MSPVFHNKRGRFGILSQLFSSRPSGKPWEFGLVDKKTLKHQILVKMPLSLVLFISNYLLPRIKGPEKRAIAFECA